MLCKIISCLTCLGNYPIFQKSKSENSVAINNNRYPSEFPPEGFKKAKNTLKGELHQGSQFHLTMEAIAARVVPIEDGYDVFSTTQWPTQTQSTVAEVLDIPAHRYGLCIHISLERDSVYYLHFLCKFL